MVIVPECKHEGYIEAIEVAQLIEKARHDERERIRSGAVERAKAEDAKVTAEKWEHPTDDYSNYWERIVRAVLEEEP